MRSALAAGSKRAVDIIGATLGLVLLSPVFIVIALLIKRSSPGPVFFRQDRIGKNGKAFRIVKFRSMRIDAEAVLRADVKLWEAYVNNDFKLPAGQDPRVTTIGRWVRKTSIDELPQLWNVLVGEMSLVGPRPLVQGEIETWYGDRAAQLLSVRPGMTGPWQVNGRSSVGYPHRAELELSYIQRRSFWGDIAILLRTVQTVLTGRGAH